jgi:TP901 family phage tail tape measure protein
MADPNITINVFANTAAANAALSGISKNIQHTGDTARTASGSVGGLSTTITGMLKPLAAATAAFLSFRAVLGFAKDVVQTASDFDGAMAEVKAVSQSADDYTTEAFSNMEKEVRRLGASTVFSSLEAAKALKMLVQGGLNVAQATESLESTLLLAQAGQLELADAAEMSAAAMNIFGLSAKDLPTVVDTLAFVANSAATDVGQLSMALKFAGPLAAATGRSLQETAAAIGVLSSAGLQGDMAGTALRGMLNQLSNESSIASRRLKALGADMTKLDPSKNSIVEIITELSKFDKTKMTAIFGSATGTGVMNLVAHLEDLKKATNDVMTKSAGSAKAVAETMSQTFPGAVERMKGAWDELMITLGKDTGLMSVLGGAVDYLTGVIEKVTSAVKVLSQAFKSGDLGTMFATSLKIGAMNAVNYLAGILSLMFKLAVTQFAARLTLLTDPEFWMGLFNVFIALGSLLNSIIMKVAADLIESARPFVAGLLQGIMYINDKIESALVIAATTFIDLMLAGVQKVLEGLNEVAGIFGLDIEGAIESVKGARGSLQGNRDEAVATFQRSLGSYAKDATTATDGLVKGLNEGSKFMTGQMEDTWTAGAGQLKRSVMGDFVDPIMGELSKFKPLDVFDTSEQQKQLDELWNKSEQALKAGEAGKKSDPVKKQEETAKTAGAAAGDKYAEVTADSLQGIGGGGGYAVSSTSAVERTADLTAKVVDNTAAIAEGVKGITPSAVSSRSITPSIGGNTVQDRQVSLLTDIKDVLGRILNNMATNKITVATV